MRQLLVLALIAGCSSSPSHPPPGPSCKDALGAGAPCSIAVSGSHAFTYALAAGQYVAVSVAADTALTLTGSYGSESLQQMTNAQPATMAFYNPTAAPLTIHLGLQAATATATITITPADFAIGFTCAKDCGSLIQLPAPRASDDYRLVSPLKYQYGRREVVETLLAALAVQTGQSPVGIMDLSQADGKVPGTDVKGPRHTYPAHAGGYAADVAYYRMNGDNSGQPTCPTATNGMSCSGPSDMDPMKNVTYFLALAQELHLVQLIVDPVMEPNVRTELQRQLSAGIADPLAAARLSRVLESGANFEYHTDHSHLAFVRDPTAVSSLGAKHSGAESAVALGPSGDVMVAFMLVDDQNAMGYAYSPNYGIDWNPMQTLPTPPGYNSNDPSLAVTADGTFYLSWFAQQMPPNGGHLYVAKSAPGSGTFAAPIDANDPSGNYSYDRPNIHVGPDGSLLLAYARGSADASMFDTINVAYSSDGAAWTHNAIAGASGMAGFRDFAYLCVAPTLRAYVGYSDAGVLHLRTSADGKTWDALDQTTIFGVPTTTDPKCVANNSDVWLLDGVAHVFPPAGAPVLDKILLAHSGDRGTTFDPPVEVEDKSAGSAFMLAGLALSYDGLISVTYYVGQSDGDSNASFVVARAKDTTATTFWPTFTIRHPVTLRTGYGPTWMGDYGGNLDAQGALNMSFTDNSSGASQTIFYRLALP
jgi:hypothetical protein